MVESKSAAQEYKHVLCLVDLTDESPTLINKAASIAKSYNAKLSLLYVMPVNYLAFCIKPAQPSPQAGLQQEIEEDVKCTLESFAEKSHYPIEHTIVYHGDLENAVKSAIEDHQIDLIVCGHHQNVYSIVFSAARKVIQSAHADVVVVPIPFNDEETCNDTNEDKANSDETREDESHGDRSTAKK